MRGFTALFVCVVLAGCGGSGSGAVPAPSPTPLLPCNFNSSVFGATQLTSPANGATGVSVSAGSVTVGYLTSLIGLTVELWPNPSVTPPNRLISGGTFVVSGGGTTLTAPIPVLNAGTQYAVQTTALQPRGVCSESVTWGLGSFST
jgi:hypothetical protein